LNTEFEDDSLKFVPNVLESIHIKGEAAFAAALDGYDRKVDAIEEQLARLLRDKLSSCQVSFV
jgi:hypothetical protein